MKANKSLERTVNRRGRTVRAVALRARAGGNQPNDDVHTYLSVFESKQASPDPRRHWCFRAASQAQVDAFYAAGLMAGGTSEGAPGLRNYHPEYYAAFLLDPEGNKVEAVFHHGKVDA